MEWRLDDRVRAISLAMGMVPIIWTSAPSSGPFDTNGKSTVVLRYSRAPRNFLVDWKVAGGMVDATTSFNTFEAILGNASTLPTGCV
jgi:hypothetical protein